MYRVLIADDEMIERTVLLRTLQKRLGDSCRIFQAENGREALEVWKREKIQIAVLDIEMPGINGIEAARQIRESDADCSIIFLTAFDEFSYARKAILVQALDYLLKPFDEKELLAVMEEAMRRTEEREKAARANAGLPGEGAADQAEVRLAEEGALPAGEAPEADNQRLSKVAQMIEVYLRENYQRDISMQELAESMNYSEPYFCKLFKQCFGQNFTSYLTDLRIAQARQLLEQPTVNIKEIGRLVGYPDSNYFAKVFKRITGQSPTEYRNHIM